MFREGRHTKKKQRRSKNMRRFFDRFFIDFPSKIDVKSREKREKRPCAQKSTKIHIWKVIFQQQIDFCSIFVVPLGPRGPPGTSREPPRIFHFFRLLSVVSENGSGQARGRPQGGPGGPPGHPQGTILGRILDRFCISKNIERISNIRATSQKLLTKMKRNVIQVCQGLNGGRPKGANDCDDCLVDSGRVIPFPILAGPEWWAPGGRQ